MAARNVASILESSPALLAKGARAADAMAALGPPGYMGRSLDRLLPPGSAAVPMPGIALGKPTQHPVHVASDAGEMSILPIAENEPQSQYYVAYGTDENKVLWLQVKVDANGNETLEGHGWKDIPTLPNRGS